MKGPSGLVMEICCSGVYTFLVTLVFEQVQCPESMKRNTFPCFHPDPEPYSPQPLLSHTHKGSTLQTPELNLFYLSETDLGVGGAVQTEKQTKKKRMTRVNHSGMGCAVVGLLEVACSFVLFCLASGLLLLPSRSISSPRSSHHSSSIYVPLPLPLSLPTFPSEG